MPHFGGTNEKCNVCSKTVYLTEKIVVEDKEDRKTFHKTCLQCSHCKVILTLGNYASMQGVFYCKPHFKQLFATKGNYDEGFGKDKHTKNWTPQAVSAPSSFIPVDKDDAGSGSGKKDTPSAIASKFGRTTLNTEKCQACNKTVYATEKTVVEEKEGKKVFHKTCLKCAHCGVIVTLGNYASMQGVVYCKPHFKQLFAAKGNYDEGFGKEKASSKWEPQAIATPATFVPVDKDEAAKDKKSTPDNVANKFTKTSTSSEKCAACGKTVYLTEKIVVEDKEDRQTFHKTCLRCSHCQVVLTLGNYASMQGVYYCKPHFKQLFAAKGNYDEGFGKEKHTKKWADKGEGERSEDAAEQETDEKNEEGEAQEERREETTVDREETERDREAEPEEQSTKEREDEQEKEEKEHEHHHHHDDDDHEHHHHHHGDDDHEHEHHHHHHDDDDEPKHHTHHDDGDDDHEPKHHIHHDEDPVEASEPAEEEHKHEEEERSDE